MKKIYKCLSVLLLLLFPVIGLAQRDADEEGFELGIFRLRPAVQALGAYDDRVVINGKEADGDVYAETEASLRVENTDARYDVSGWAAYGYRWYDEYSVLSDDLYHLGCIIASREDALKLGLYTDLKKTLDYDVTTDNGTGSDLGAILTPDASTRASVKADIGYESPLTSKSAIMPRYEGWYYYQEFEQQSDAEWQEHQASLQFGYGVAAKTVLMLTGSYNVQINDEEDGSVATIAIDAKSRATDKINWYASAGIAAANYEISGSDQSPVGSVRARWQATEKVSAYVFGRSNFQPGYGGGGASRVYRAGYGVYWTLVDKLRTDFQVLHDYNEDIEGDSAGSSSDELRHFFSGKITYDLTQHIALALTGRYVNDDEYEDRTVVSCRAVFSY